MAVEWRHLIFGDVDSADYGIYISGDGVYNAPERAVEFVDVPGRNGAIALDQGRYNNITVTYPAGTFAKTQEEFRESLSAFRNAILSQKGYQRLEDTYHPDEYRMGLYSSGLEVSPVAYNKAGEFELAFNCKPQRWLTIGELPIPVDSGDVLQNPTPFDAGPLLEITGYGDVSFNGFTVSLENAVLGKTTLLSRSSRYDAVSSIENTFLWDTALYNAGDILTINSINFYFSYASRNHIFIGPATYTVNASTSVTPTIKGLEKYTTQSGGNTIDFYVVMPQFTYTAGDVGVVDATITVTAPLLEGGSKTVTAYVKIEFVDGGIKIHESVTEDSFFDHYELEYVFEGVTVGSSLSILGNPTYIDCDLGEAYRMEGDTPISLNARVALGSDLPVLAPGSNKITFDNTITDLKIAPRWWRI